MGPDVTGAESRPRASSREHGVANSGTREAKAGADVRCLEVRELHEDLCRTQPIRQEIEYFSDPNSHAANAWPAAGRLAAERPAFTHRPSLQGEDRRVEPLVGRRCTAKVRSCQATAAAEIGRLIKILG